MPLNEKILNKKARIGVIGLGYVGLPLAVEFAKKGFQAIGIDINEERVKKINAGESYILDTEEKDIEALVAQKRLEAVSHYEVLKHLDTISICVPTPLRKTKEPDISYIVSAVREIARYLHKGQLIILESTTYPGTTDEVILPLLQSSGLKVGQDFYLAFSPERVDPGNPTYKTNNIPKVVGGITPQCTKMAKLLYEQVIEKVIPLSSTKVAETVKLLENTFRSVNIALVNELALISNRLGIDVWEVIEAAATKPFGFMPFYPGPGLGGHCIPIDPQYLSWKARMNDFNAKFIDLAGEINKLMPEYVVTRVVDALNHREKSVKSSQILILGVAYKKDVKDSRESPAEEIIRILQKKEAQILYNDPYIPEFVLDNSTIHSMALTDELLEKTDCVVIVTDHSCYDFPGIVEKSNLVIDTRNATKGIEEPKKIVKL
ncbi:MAG: nucleotide sugar dehydrogenase [Nitrospirae bacterium]|nr:nucleotide sugar dehydrogenase [Nitrospirota bacterium]